MLFTKKNKLVKTLQDLEDVMKDIAAAQKLIDEARSKFPDDASFQEQMTNKQFQLDIQRFQTDALRLATLLKLNRTKFYQ